MFGFGLGPVVCIRAAPLGELQAELLVVPPVVLVPFVSFMELSLLPLYCINSVPSFCEVYPDVACYA